jgi:hypothetical protein
MKNMRDIEEEIPNQSNVLPPLVIKEHAKKHKLSVQSIIDSISFPSIRYSPIFVSPRASQLNETLTIISQTPYSLFSLFFCFDLFEIVAKNTNNKANKKYSRDNKKQRAWHDTSASEIEAFLGILLYMRLALIRVAVGLGKTYIGQPNPPYWWGWTPYFVQWVGLG